MEIHEKIRNIRLAKGLTQEYVAKKLNIDPVNYGRLERGQSALTIKRLEKLAEILEFDIVDLFTQKEQEQIIPLLKKIYKTEILIFKELKNNNNKN